MSAQVLSLRENLGKERLKPVKRNIWWGQVVYSADPKTDDDVIELGGSFVIKKKDGTKIHKDKIVSNPIFVEAANKTAAEMKIIHYFIQMRPDTKYHILHDTIPGQDGPYQIEILKHQKAS